MILTISDSEEGILNKIKSVLACESTLEVMEITNSEKLTFQGLEIDQLQRSVIKDGKVVELTRHEYDLLFYLALSPNRVPGAVGVRVQQVRSAGSTGELAVRPVSADQ